MNYLNAIRRLLACLVLVAVSTAGLFGPALHGVAHLGESTNPSCACSCQNCPIARDAAEQEQRQKNVQEEHDCAVCRFLALAKLVDEVDSPSIPLTRLDVQTCQLYAFSLSSAFDLSSAPRGPPLDCVRV